MAMVPAKGKKASNIDQTARRVWDKEDAREKAAEREKVEAKNDKDGGETVLDIRKRKRLERDPFHTGQIQERSQLKQRDYQIDLSARLGKTQVVGLNMPLSQQAGYYCNVCDCILRDSQSYLDHINGKWHNRALGMTMRVEKSTVDQVRNKLDEVKQKREQIDEDEFLPDGIDRRILEAQAREEKEKEDKRSRKQEKKAKDRAQDVDLEEGADAEMMAAMGFGGFGTAKK
mmetsp:Transcript_2668/g.4554  ORF Transcript_2668/g.4554 Transcript_2668/m.4554 type:complete len:230 (+) Transcript_2668:77-766(+)|eukprot:CAMPEP_0119102574 /NCGR_PEP_ID=MMETSP1180-20130426/1280_1 /TAXON_ID=3052 ORGANISM="Chlamydomonas cf sp, Strain CCMP681" /NCGR_SAMPLE_ID=MMETSP1180 /ASSEMBLY_ACC=CAM_ASM_000741 /LENGTH=229 /DNA_ID=CAMNT_0007086887 /DNA_START=72 /DNA_END=761 /DNA_ORIENTATION=+